MSTSSTASTRAPIRVFIEGNIGSGKSCLISLLQDKGWICALEPLHKWDEVLQLYYKHPETYAYHLQHCVMSSIAIRDERVSQLHPSEKVLVFERSLESSRLFTKNCLNRRYIDDEKASLLAKSTAAFENKSNQQDVYVYLKCPVEECCQRILRRSRNSETNSDSFLSSDLERYIVELDALHEDRFGQGSSGGDVNAENIWVVDATQSIGKVLEAVSGILATL